MKDKRDLQDEAEKKLESFLKDLVNEYEDKLNIEYDTEADMYSETSGKKYSVLIEPIDEN